jgi:hypothetical protein
LTGSVNASIIRARFYFCSLNDSIEAKMRGPWRMWQRFLMFVGVVSGLVVFSIRAADKPDEKSEEENLYYAVDRAFSDTDHVEVRAAFGYDISNPYLGIYGPQAGIYYLISPHLAAGLEGSWYLNYTKETTKDLATLLARNGYSLDPVGPDFGMVAAVRATPIAGMLNLLTANVLKGEISLLGRGGAIHYPGVGTGPTLGLGLEVGVRVKSGLGIVASVLWDWDHPASGSWLTRTGFRIGPTLRF